MPFPKKKPEGSPGEERGESSALERSEQRNGLEKKKPGKKGFGVHDGAPMGKVEPNELFLPTGRN
jgi:hypothetical protein